MWLEVDVLWLTLPVVWGAVANERTWEREEAENVGRTVYCRSCQ